MQFAHIGRNGLIVLALAVGAVGAAVGMSEREPPLVLPEAGQPAERLEAGQPANSIPEADHARALSKVFRHVSREALPSIVSIETRGPAQRLAGGPRAFPFDDDDSPFGEFFRNDPRLREFFRRQQPDRIQVPQNMGSGFIIDATGVIMTNSHVVRNAERVTVRLYDGREFTANNIKTDPLTDVAIIHIEVPEDVTLRPIKLGDSDQMEIGDWVLAVGSPFGLDLTVTAGIISAKGRNLPITGRADFLQTDAAINPGNSGGPLLNLDGEVIGISTAISSRSGGSHGVGFAIPVNQAKWVAAQLMERGEVQRAYLGVTIQEVDHALARQFGVRPGEGVIVTQILPGSPAADAGLRPGDVIVELADRPANTPRQLQGIVEQLEVDRTYPLVMLREGRQQRLDVTLHSMPAELAAAPAPQPQRELEAPGRFEALGIEVRELTPEAARQLGVEGSRGVLVSSVEPGSTAQLAGLRAGDVIEEVGRRPVTSPREFEDALREANLEDGVLFLVRNARGSRFLSIQAR